MFRPLLKITCLTFACATVGYIAAMVQHNGHAYVNLGDCIGAAQAQEITEPAEYTGISPEVKNGINYMTGGVGDEERAALEAHKADYNFHLVMTSTDGSFTGDVTLSIDTANANVLPQTVAGPIFYANLKPATYKITVIHNGKTKQMTVVIPASKPVYQQVSL